MYFAIFFIAIVSAALGLMLGIQELPYLTNGFEAVERYCTSGQVVGLFRATAAIGTVGGAIFSALSGASENRPVKSA